MNRKYFLLFVVIIILGIIAVYIFQVPQEEPEDEDQKVLVDWEADGVIFEDEDETEYPHKNMYSNGKFIVYWRNDEEYLYIALKAQTVGWVAIGFDPSSRMNNADMILGWVEDLDVTVLDLYSTGFTGPHQPDTNLGGTNNILEFGGSEYDGWTIIEIKRKLNTGDEYDKAFTTGQTIKIIWAMADVDESTEYHNIDRGSGELVLD